MAARSLLALTFALIVGLSLTRTAALLINYGAPMRIYKALPQVWFTGKQGAWRGKDMESRPVLQADVFTTSHNTLKSSGQSGQSMMQTCHGTPCSSGQAPLQRWSFACFSSNVFMLPA